MSDGCKNCGKPLVWVPDRGGRWTHYRADFSCGRPEPGDPPVQRWETTLDLDEAGGH
jgi:hypothetical protein